MLNKCWLFRNSWKTDYGGREASGREMCQIHLLSSVCCVIWGQDAGNSNLLHADFLLSSASRLERGGSDLLHST